MREIIITANDSGRRLDRFLRKYLRHASLGDIYKIIRKDVKVGGRRKDESYILAEGDVLSLYLSDEVIDSLTADTRSSKAGSFSSRNVIAMPMSSSSASCEYRFKKTQSKGSACFRNLFSS